MQLTQLYYTLAAVALIVAGVKGFVGLVRWYNGRLKKSGETDYELRIKDEFIYDVATNHLPHIEKSLEMIAGHLGLEIPEHPPIKWLRYDPSKK